ncbi:unnamed protein product [Brachionus calyciflorus]|uniref:ORC1/DEAH AAA+ ATPase domain-containing protein n=1 Tax=Brachionus calyciflorus TaxID=104777 RepID=A0A814HM18_9BILA|nr:unnamed protein product [Brachionus calyciflorus]
MTDSKIIIPISCESILNSLSDSDIHSAISNLSFSSTSNSTTSITSSSSFSTDSEKSSPHIFPLQSPSPHKLNENSTSSDTSSPFKNKKFYAKDWLFTKLNEIVYKSQLVVLLGEYGTGKSHLIYELKNRDKKLNFDVIATHCFTLFAKNNLENFYENLTRSILGYFKKTVINTKNENYSDLFINNVLEPLNEIQTQNNCVILIDGLDELVHLDRLDLNENLTEEILNFIFIILKKFPKWLSVVITARRSTEKTFLRNKFSSYEKISIDRGLNLNKIISSSKSSHSLSQKSDLNRHSTPIDLGNLNNLRDLQIYILNRLNSDNKLKLKLNSKLDKSIELLNLLLIKSNNSILYINIIFNLVLNSLFTLQDLKHVESNLNGLYKYCFKLFENKFNEVPNCKDLIKTLLGIILLDKNLDNLYAKIKIRYRNLNPTLYDQIYDLLDKIFDLKNHVNLISFYEFLFTDEDSLEEAYFCLGFYYFNKKNLDKFKFYLKKCKNLIKDFDYFYSLINPEKKNFQSDPNDPNLKNIIFDFVTLGDLESIKSLQDPKISSFINELRDSYDQTCLLVSVKLNHVKLVEYFVKLESCDLDYCDSSGWTALRYAAWTGNEQIVNILVKNGATIDLADKDLRTPLRAAVFSGHENVVKILIKSGADVNKTDLENRSILHVATYMGHLSIVNILLQSGASLNHQDLLGRSILATSIYCINSQNRMDIIKLLIKNGAKIDQFDHNNQTPLILAGLENEIKIIDQLLSNNADIDHIDNLGHTILTHAIKNGYDEQVEYLLKKNAATHILDPDGRSILSIASSLGHEHIVGLLMQKDLDEMHRDNNGWTPLHEACFHGHKNVILMLLNYGSEIDAVDNQGRTSLYLACLQGHLGIVKILLENKANFNIKTHEDESIFQVSLNESKFQISQILIDRGYFVDDLDLEGKSTLQKFIIQNKDVCEQIIFLLDSNASTNLKDSNGQTSLHLAINGTIDLINLLANYAADLNAQDLCGNTPLLLACLGNKLNLAKVLIDKKCNLDMKNNKGESALAISIRNRNYELCEELLKNGCCIDTDENPIKLANLYNFTEIVSLIQYYTALNFIPNKSDSLNLNFNNRCLITQNTFSSYMNNLSHRNRTFVLNLDDTEYEDSKSRIKIVKEKIFGHGSSGESSSLRIFLSSFRKGKHDEDIEKPKSKSIVQYIWKKFKIGKDKDSFSHQSNNKIQRSVTDTIASNLMYSKNDTLMTSFDTLTNVDSRQDDASYIFNRNSLSDCLSPHNKNKQLTPNFSYRNIQVKQYNFNNNNNNQKLDIEGYFKKETSI